MQIGETDHGAHRVCPECGFGFSDISQTPPEHFTHHLSGGPGPIRRLVHPAEIVVTCFRGHVFDAREVVREGDSYLVSDLTLKSA